MYCYEYYDFSNLIDAQDRAEMSDSVRLSIEEGKYWTNSPKFQTNFNVFSLPHSAWVKLKMSFIWSCFAYLDREVQIKQIQAWSFMTSLKTAEDRDILWHHHNHDINTKTVSGVFYLQLPEDVQDLEKAGTELAPAGVNEESYFAPWKTGHWMIYPGAVWHRPGVLQSNQNRFIVAADLEF